MVKNYVKNDFIKYNIGGHIESKSSHIHKLNIDHSEGEKYKRHNKGGTTILTEFGVVDFILLLFNLGLGVGFLACLNSSSKACIIYKYIFYVIIFGSVGLWSYKFYNIKETIQLEEDKEFYDYLLIGIGVCIIFFIIIVISIKVLQMWYPHEALNIGLQLKKELPHIPILHKGENSDTFKTKSYHEVGSEYTRVFEEMDDDKKPKLDFGEWQKRVTQANTKLRNAGEPAGDNTIKSFYFDVEHFLSPPKINTEGVIIDIANKGDRATEEDLITPPQTHIDALWAQNPGLRPPPQPAAGAGAGAGAGAIQILQGGPMGAYPAIQADSGKYNQILRWKEKDIIEERNIDINTLKNKVNTYFKGIINPDTNQLLITFAIHPNDRAAGPFRLLEFTRPKN